MKRRSLLKSFCAGALALLGVKGKAEEPELEWGPEESYEDWKKRNGGSIFADTHKDRDIFVWTEVQDSKSWTIRMHGSDEIVWCNDDGEVWSITDNNQLNFIGKQDD